MAGESFVATDLYAPVLKAHEARLLLAIAAAEGSSCLVYKTDTSQAFLYGSMENDVVYIRAPDWSVSKASMDLSISKACMVPDSDHRWHKHILAWMESNGYLAVNSENTIFKMR